MLPFRRTQFSNLTNDELVRIGTLDKELTEFEYELVCRMFHLMNRMDRVEDALDESRAAVGYWDTKQMNLPLVPKAHTQ